MPRDSERLQLIGVGVGAVTPKDVLIARTCRDDAGVPCAVYASATRPGDAEAARDAARHRVAVRTHRVFHDLLVELLESGAAGAREELARMHNDKTVEPPDELRGGAVLDQEDLDKRGAGAYGRHFAVSLLSSWGGFLIFSRERTHERSHHQSPHARSHVPLGEVGVERGRRPNCDAAGARAAMSDEAAPVAARAGGKPALLAG